ncbi:MAG: hypothetical protein LIP00_10510 [Parabacteroides sp.]|nr:hypothetical protein [Parabacteroides sp.]
MENTTYSPFGEIERLLLVKTEKNETRIISTAQLLLAAQKGPDGKLKKDFVKNFITVYCDLEHNKLQEDPDFIRQLRLVDEIENENALFAWAYDFNSFIVEKGFSDILKGAADDDDDEAEDSNQPKQEQGEAIVLTMFLWIDSPSPYMYIGNQSLAVFTHFCQSILKAEYLYDDFLSKEKIVPLKKVLEETMFQKRKYKRSFLYVEESSLDTDTYLKDIAKLCHLYYEFNRKIDNTIDDNSHAVLQLIKEGSTEYELSRYEEGINLLSLYKSSNSCYLVFSYIFPYLFRFLLEMTYIDHNFTVGNTELNSLLTLRSVIKRIRQVFEDYPELSSSFDLKIMKNFFLTLDLIASKNDFLIYKILISDQSGRLKNYTFVSGEHIVSFNSKNIEPKESTKECLNKEKLVCAYCPDETNDLLRESNVYQQLLVNKNFWNRETSFLLYEEYFFKAITHNEPDKVAAYFAGIKNAYKARIEEFDGTRHKDILSYNKKIVSHARHQFIKYGAYIKRLSRLDEQLRKGLETNDDERKRYVTELADLLNDVPEIYSCSFIVKHTRFLLDELESLCSEEKYDNLGFKLRNLIETQLVIFKNLLNRIESGNYCTNFAALYQDCYYRFGHEPAGNAVQPVQKAGRPEPETVQPELFRSIRRIPLRQQEQAGNGLQLPAELETVFIASTWLRPVSKLMLRDYYDKFNYRKVTLVAKFYAAYFNAQQKNSDKNLAEFNKKVEDANVMADESRRSTVQTLGIFAAFLAIATISAQALKGEPKDFMRIMFSITFCLGTFVLLLEYVIKLKKSAVILYIFLAVILVLIVFLSGGDIIGGWRLWLLGK